MSRTCGWVLALVCSGRCARTSPFTPRGLAMRSVPKLVWAILYLLLQQQEAFEKCWAHSPQRAVSRQFTRCRHCTVAHRLRIDVHNDDNDNAWQRGPLWPHGMGPIMRFTIGIKIVWNANLPIAKLTMMSCPLSPICCWSHCTQATKSHS